MNNDERSSVHSINYTELWQRGSLRLYDMLRTVWKEQVIRFNSFGGREGDGCMKEEKRREREKGREGKDGRETE